MKKRLLALLIAICIIVPSYVGLGSVESEAATLTPVLNADYRTGSSASVNGTWTSGSRTNGTYETKSDVYSLKTNTVNTYPYYTSSTSNTISQNSFSIETYFYYDQSLRGSNSGQIFSFRSTNSTAQWTYYMGTDPNHQIIFAQEKGAFYEAFYVRAAEIGRYTFANSTTLSTGWHHMIIVLSNNNVGGGGIKLYLDNGNNPGYTNGSAQANPANQFKSGSIVFDRFDLFYGVALNAGFFRVYAGDISSYKTALYNARNNVTQTTHTGAAITCSNVVVNATTTATSNWAQASDLLGTKGSWSTSNSSIATITSGGVVTGKAAGSVEIRQAISYGTATTYIRKTITVSNPAPTASPVPTASPRPSLAAVYTMDSNTTNADSANIPVTANFSMEWYGNLNNATPNNEFFLGGLWQLEYDGTNIYTWQYNGSSYASQYASSFGSRKDYVHIVLTVDGKTTKFYVNGALAKTITLPYNGNCNQSTGTAYSNFNFQSYMRKANNCGTVVIYNRDMTLAEVQAKYEDRKPTYTITWKDGNGNNFGNTSTVKWGATPSKPSGTPSKSATAQYTYTYNGNWNTSNSLDNGSDNRTAAYGNATYYAQFSKSTNSYTITFKNGNTVLATPSVAYGSTPSYSGTPTKDSTAQYTYTFDGWSTTDGGAKLNSLPSVTGAATYYAHYSSSVRSYTITFKNGNTVLATPSVTYGSTPSCSGTPTKASTAQYDYTFDGWSTTDGGAKLESLPSVTGAATYYAHFTATTRKYTVTWKNYDGSVLETDSNVLYGSTPSYDGSTPTKPSTTESTFTFTGWSPAISQVTGDVIYTAQFSSSARTYTITFKNGTTVLATPDVAYGTQPTYSGTPTKAATSQYTYTFDGWITSDTESDWTDPEVVATATGSLPNVSGATTYYAHFSRSTNNYVVTAIARNTMDEPIGSVSGGGTFAYGTSVTLTATVPTGYTLLRWEKLINDAWTEVPGETGLSITFTLEHDEDYKAVLSATGDFTLTVMADEFEINDVPGIGMDIKWFNSKDLITVEYTSTDHTFQYWVNEADKVVSTSASYSFYITANTTLKAITTSSDGDRLVVYMSAYNQVLSSGMYNGITIYSTTQPAGPSKLGYNFLNWDKTIKQLSDMLNSASTERTIVVNPVYEKIEERKSITVQYQDASGNTIKDSYVYGVNYGNSKNLTAPEIDGHEFSYWKIGTQIVSYGTSYRIRPFDDITVVAVYDEDSVTVAPTVAITGKTAATITGGYKVSFTSTRSVPEGYELLKQGIIYTTDSSVANGGDFNISNTSSSIKVIEGNDTSANGNTTFNINTKSASRVYYVMGYITYRHNGEIFTVHSTMDSGSYNTLHG